MTFVRAHRRKGRRGPQGQRIGTIRVKAYYRIVHRVGGVHTLRWAKMVRALVREGHAEESAYKIATKVLGKAAFNVNRPRRT